MQSYKINLLPSGLNSHFYAENLKFNDYIGLMRHIITESRHDLVGTSASKIVVANSPFAWNNNDNRKTKAKNGILLIHGLFDSPYYTKDLGEYFSSRGFVVQSILLPGHGTVAGDLLAVDHHEWYKAVNFGIKSLSTYAENIYIGGYSLGGVLAIHKTLKNTEANIRGLFLFAPALQPKNIIKNLAARYHKIFSWSCNRAKWFHISKITNSVKYTSYTYNGGYQTCKVISATQKLLKTQSLDIPLFVIMTEDDETVSNRAIISFFKSQNHPKSKLLIYTNNPQGLNDARIIIRKSHFPQQRILNFSHICLTISPKDPIFGEDSNYRDFSHYHNNKIKKKYVCQGAVTRKNLSKYAIQRLCYNPDYYQLLNYLDEFINMNFEF